MTKENAKTITLGDFITRDQMQKCIELYPDSSAICEQVVKPNMDEINRKLGQDNDARYIAYLIVHVIGSAGQHALN